MPFKYNRLFALLAMRGLKATDLRNMTGLSAPTMSKLVKGEPVNTRVLCQNLQSPRVQRRRHYGIRS